MRTQQSSGDVRMDKSVNSDSLLLFTLVPFLTTGPKGGQVVGAKLESFAPVYEHKWMSSMHVAHSSMSWNHTNSPPCNSSVRAPVARCCSSGETNVDFHYNLEDKVGGEPIISSAKSHPWSDLTGRYDDRPSARWGIYASRKRFACLESSSL